MKAPAWFTLFFLAVLLGVGAGYFITLAIRPSLIPAALRWGSLTKPATILFLGTDVVYDQNRGRARADAAAFTGRSDTIMVARLDPIRNSLAVLSIPRDTEVYISGYGRQKINAANAIGGPTMAEQVVSQFLGIPIDHYVVLNVHGIVELVNALGGITVEIPKRMKYMDWTAKLKIDLEPGFHTLTGNQAMGFVRFRHDALGDIGRVQRQEIFIRACLDKALKPESWAKIPELIAIGRQHVLTDLNDGQILSILAFVRAVPKKDQQLVMLPGNFAADGSGNWVVDQTVANAIAAKMVGAMGQTSNMADFTVTIQNASSDPSLARRLAKFLRTRGYNVLSVKSAEPGSEPAKRTKIIAQRANPEQADLVRAELGNIGDLVNASVGDIETSVTVVAGEDMEPVVRDVVTQYAHQ